MIQNNNCIPSKKDWVWIDLGFITTNFDGNRIPVNSDKRKNMQGIYPYYGASGIIDHVNEYLFNGEYLLVAEDGANLLSRSTPISFQAKGKFWVNNHAHILQSKANMPLTFIEYYLNHTNIKEYITGTAQPKLTQKALNKILIPLPPLAEQYRIVAKIEELFTILDAGVESLKNVKAQLKQYKQSIIRDAFEGKLTEEWRTKNHYTEKNWNHVTVKEISKSIQYGTSEKATEEPIGIPVIRMGNIQDGKITFDNLKYLPKESPSLSDFPQCPLM